MLGWGAEIQLKWPKFPFNFLRQDTTVIVIRSIVTGVVTSMFVCYQCMVEKKIREVKTHLFYNSLCQFFWFN